jgi:hypothetical protein
MVNISKAKDSRFWKKWRASGAVETIEGAWKRKPFFFDYLKIVDYVKSGLTDFEPEARLLAQQHGFSLQPLEEALSSRIKDKYHQEDSIVSERIISYISGRRQIFE